MTIKAVLDSYIKKNQTQNIRLYVNFQKSFVYIQTPFHVKKDEFNKEKGVVRKNNPNANQINRFLLKRKREIEETLFETGNINALSNDSRSKTKSLLSFLQEFTNEINEGRSEIKKSTGKSYTSLLNNLTAYKTAKKLKDISFNDITLEFYDDFKLFLFNRGCGNAGFGKYIKNLKAIMRNSMERGLHKNRVYEHPHFKRPRAPKNSRKIYLTEAEIEKLEKLDLSSLPHLEKERDRFLVCYYFLMRFTDSMTITKNMFTEQEGKTYIRYTQQKTGHTCIVPVSSKVKGYLEKHNYDFNFSANQIANRELKIVCAMAKIDDIVQQGSIEAPKWKFVTTHTARRSIATNLSMKNVSLKIIADLGGWTDLHTLRIYLRSSGLESAKIAKDIDLFQ